MKFPNKVLIAGRLLEKAVLRYTPAGIPVAELTLLHESAQMEAGAPRQVRCEVACICLGDEAAPLSALPVGCEIVVKGFLAAKSRRWPGSLILHISDWQPAQLS